jgi:LDH2 family malate/lactate/ureidoglycolate dehydrogenase
MIVFRSAELHETATRIFHAAGAEPEPTAILVDHLIDANLAGHDSHGVQLIPWYVRDVREGRLQANARPDVLRETPVAALIDGKFTFGQVSARYATEIAIRKAKEGGVAVVGLVRCHHIGRLGTYPTLGARQGVVLMVTTGDLGGATAPFGGRRPLFGTNPFSFGFPAGDRPDLLVDFATSTIAWGKVAVARAKHEPIPPGCVLDKDGNPTTDPNALYDGGMLLPFGGHKGSALATLSVLLSQVLVPTAEHGGTGGSDLSGTFFLAIDAGLFRDPSTVRAETDQVFSRIRDVPAAPGFVEVLVPGEPEVRTAALRREEGIPVPDDTWAEIVEAAKSVGVVLSSDGGA